MRQIAGHPAIDALAARISSGGHLAARGIAGSSAVITAALLQQRTAAPLLLVLPHIDDADEAFDELTGLGVDAAQLPVMELLPGESSVNPDLLAERLALVDRVRAANMPQVICASFAALMQGVPDDESLKRMHRVIRPGDSIEQGEFICWLTDVGYTRVDAIAAAGEFAVRGGILDIFPPGAEPTRIDLFGDDVEQINVIDLETMGSDRKLDDVMIVGASLEQLQTDRGAILFPSLLPNNAVAVLVEVAELTEQGRSYFDRATETGGIFGPPAVFKSLDESLHSVVQINHFSPGAGSGDEISLPVESLPTFAETAGNAVRELGELAATSTIFALCQNDGELQRLGELIIQHAGSTAIALQKIYLHRGFIWAGDSQSIALVPQHELLHRYQLRRSVRRVAAGRAVDAFIDLQPGDYVVHRDHGIARFAGVRTMKPSPGKPSEEYLTLEFARSAKLHVAATKIELVQKYIGAFRGQPELSTLGGRKWKTQKEKVKEAVRDLAKEMLQLQATRESMPGIRYPADTIWQKEFEAEFPYDETEDQLTAIASVKRDMAEPRPMDRLICGDVGFGKTEVAIRAAFKAAEFGRQVAVLVPTTVLAEQHERTFRGRFAAYPFRIESLSRFKTAKQQKQTLEALARSEVDIIIGTHRLLSKDVHFADLGLVIVDEEQRFGVEHKQRLLTMRTTVDVITMSATPIPRTLHMSMLGLRDISSLTTAPADRRAIVTEVIAHNEHRLRQAIERELAREGQVFYVHNRVHNIREVADFVQKLAPKAKILIGHGQMPARELESVMLKFVRGDADILVSTTIIESGIDIPTANTMIINEAQMFGLSELHQLRGRVGRHKHRAYCYLMLPQNATISETAVKRLRALESFSMLGAGFKIAMRDLEIRGAGNLLGAEQSGHISAVGYEMYCQLLQQSVEELKHQPRTNVIDTTIDMGIAGSIPKGYIPADARRLDAYRRISQATSYEELEQVQRDLESAYGSPPTGVQHLLELSEIRIAAAELGVVSLTRHDDDLIFRTRHPRKLEQAMGDAKGTLRLVGQPDASGLSEVYYRPPKNYFEGTTILTVLRHRLHATVSAEPSVAIV